MKITPTSGFTTWEGSQELANHIMEEFWQQGDDETSKGLTTLDNIEPILDRRQSVNLPSLEVNRCLKDDDPERVEQS